LAGVGSRLLRKPGTFHALRSLLVETVTDRSRPLWLRLLLIGSLCQRLQEIVTAGAEETIPQFLSDYRRRLQTQGFDPELEAMPGDPALKLEVVLKLTDARARERTCGKRFRDTFWSFIEGIAPPDSSTPGGDIGCFLHAERTVHRPFFEKHPFIPENYLLNYIFQNLFPLGREGIAEFAPRSMFDEFILMTTQFAWINALLIGVAGRHKQAFAAEHVVEVVQSFTREVEHYPPVLNWILASMKERRMDNLQGMSILLRI
jgi:lysine-N-methylase